MTTFDDREKGFEKKFAHDQDLKFKAESRRNKMLGEWAAGLMGITGAILWFENTSIGLFTKLGFDISRTIHFYEAILATLAVIVWVPDDKVREKVAPVPIWPSRLDVHTRLDDKLPSVVSLAEPLKETVVFAG